MSTRFSCEASTSTKVTSELVYVRVFLKGARLLYPIRGSEFGDLGHTGFEVQERDKMNKLRNSGLVLCVFIL